MFLGRLLLVFLIIPAIMVLAVIWTPVSVRLWLMFLVFPAALILYSIWRQVRPGRRTP